jgi:hypothetical protein
VLAPDEVDGRGDRLVVDRLHPLRRQRPGVLDPLRPDAPVPLFLGRVVFLRRPRVDHAARTEPPGELRKLSGRRPVRVLRLLLGVQVVQVAEELIEAVDRRQVLVQVTQMVLTELPCRVAQRLHQLGNGRVLGLQADIGARHTHLAQPSPVDALPGDERRTARRAALLPIRIGEPHPLLGDPVDVGRAVPHQAAAVAA